MQFLKQDSSIYLFRQEGWAKAQICFPSLEEHALDRRDTGTFLHNLGGLKAHCLNAEVRGLLVLRWKGRCSPRQLGRVDSDSASVHGTFTFHSHLVVEHIHCRHTQGNKLLALARVLGPTQISVITTNVSLWTTYCSFFDGPFTNAVQLLRGPNNAWYA